MEKQQFTIDDEDNKEIKAFLDSLRDKDEPNFNMTDEDFVDWDREKCIAYIKELHEHIKDLYNELDGIIEEEHD